MIADGLIEVHGGTDDGQEQDRQQGEERGYDLSVIW